MTLEIVGYEHLHLHTDFSTLDGYGMVEEYATRAPIINQKFLTISDHGMLGAIPRQIKACDKINDKKGRDTLSPIFACLPKGHPIHTMSGAADISEIQRLTQVLTHKGRYRAVLRVMKRRHVGKMYSIGLAGVGRSKKVLRLTGEHPVLISDRDGNTRWVKAEDIQAERLRAGRGINNHSAYVCLPRLQEGERQQIALFDYVPDYIKISKDGVLERRDKSRPYRWEKYPQWLDLDEETAFFLGLFVAEGSFSQKRRKLTGGMRLTLNIEESSLADRAATYLATLGINSNKYEYPDNSKMELCFGCVPFAYFLYKTCGAGAKNKKIPLDVMNSPNHIREAFLDGLLAGDGKKPGEDGKGQKTLRIASKRLAYDARLLLAAVGRWASVTERYEGKGKRTYTVPVSGNVEYQRFIATDDYILKPISFVRCEEVDEDVYNFEVEEDNSYVSEFAVHNCELYVNRLQPEAGSLEDMQRYMADLSEEEQQECRAGAHLLAIAYNEAGYKNLVRLSSWAWTKGFYRRPRVNYDQLKKYKEGLYFTSCCYNSEVGRAFDQHGEDAAFQMIERYVEMFGKDNYFLELMLLDFDKQKPYDEFIVKAHLKYGLKLILTNDCHYCQAEDSHFQRLMLMVQTNRTIEEINRAIAEDSMKDFFELQDANLWMKSEEELNAKWLSDYKDIIPYELFCQAKRNTVEICNKAKGVQLDRSLKLPVLPDADEILKEEVMKGFKKRGLPQTREYLDRIKEEYSLITRKGFSSYFLIQKKMTDEARRYCKEILGGDGSQAVGPGRGSAVGALTCYCLGITNVDPIYEGLLFSRFMSEARGGRSIVLEFRNMDPLPPEESFAA